MLFGSTWKTEPIFSQPVKNSLLFCLKSHKNPEISNSPLLVCFFSKIKYLFSLWQNYNFPLFLCFLCAGTQGGIRLYMQELIAITQKALQSQSWKMKAQGAAAMASVAKQTGSLVPPHLGIVLSALLQGLPGRTWTGKVKMELVPCGLL